MHPEAAGSAAVRGAEMGLVQERPKDEDAAVTFSWEDVRTIGVGVSFSTQLKNTQENCIVVSKNKTNKK